MNFFIIDFIFNMPHLSTGQVEMDYEHENDSESCDRLGNRFLRTCIRPDDGFHGSGRTDGAGGPLLPVL